MGRDQATSKMILDVMTSQGIQLGLQELNAAELQVLKLKTELVGAAGSRLRDDTQQEFLNDIMLTRIHEEVLLMRKQIACSHRRSLKQKGLMPEAHKPANPVEDKKTPTESVVPMGVSNDDVMADEDMAYEEEDSKDKEVIG